MFITLEDANRHISPFEKNAFMKQLQENERAIFDCQLILLLGAKQFLDGLQIMPDINAYKEYFESNSRVGKVLNKYGIEDHVELERRLYRAAPEGGD